MRASNVAAKVLVSKQVNNLTPATEEVGLSFLIFVLCRFLGGGEVDLEVGGFR